VNNPGNISSLVADPRKAVCRVLSSSVSVPASVSNGLARDVSVVGVSNSGPESSGSVSLVSASACVWWDESAVWNNLMSRAFEPREVVGGVLFSTVWEPAVVSFGLAGNVSPLSVSNGNPDLSSSIVLESVRNKGRWVRNVSSAGENERWGHDPIELVGLVFFSTVSVPAGISNGLARDFSVRSVGNSAPEGSSSVILVSNGDSAWW